MIQSIFNFLKDFFMLKYLPELGRNAGFGILFLFGILTSVHCIGMCGGIVLSQCTNAPGSTPEQAGAKAGKWFVPSALYNAGRVVSYTLVGAIVGGLGQIISFQGAWKGIVPVIGGLFMIVMAVNLLGLFPALRRFVPRMPGSLARKIFGGSFHNPFLIGLLTGLMPCGPLQMIQLYALGTGSAIYGAISMLIFTLGTVPVLFLFGAVNTIINKKHSVVILKTSAVLVLLLGLMMIGRGLALSGISVPMPYSPVSSDQSTTVVNGNIQKVTTRIGPGSFPPITVQKGIRVLWTIHADKENLNKCNNAIVIPEYGIETNLAEGDTLVEFTPHETGEFVYTCWMGMIKSRITVVEDLKHFSAETNDQRTESSKSQAMCSDNRMNNSTQGGMSRNMCMADDSEPTMPAEGFHAEAAAGAGDETASDRSAAAEGAAAGSAAKGGAEIVKSAAAKEGTPAKEGAAESSSRTADSAEVTKAAGTAGSEAFAETSGQTDFPAAKDAEQQTLNGYLQDKHCFGLVKPERDTLFCLKMNECEASGYGLAVDTGASVYRFYPFDEKGNELAMTVIAKSQKESGLRVAVKGAVENGKIRAVSIIEQP